MYIESYFSVERGSCLSVSKYMEGRGMVVKWRCTTHKNCSITWKSNSHLQTHTFSLVIPHRTIFAWYQVPPEKAKNISWIPVFYHLLMWKSHFCPLLFTLQNEFSIKAHSSISIVNMTIFWSLEKCIFPAFIKVEYCGSIFWEVGHPSKILAHQRMCEKFKEMSSNLFSRYLC